MDRFSTPPFVRGAGGGFSPNIGSTPGVNRPASREGTSQHHAAHHPGASAAYASGPVMAGGSSGPSGYAAGGQVFTGPHGVQVPVTSPQASARSVTYNPSPRMHYDSVGQVSPGPHGMAHVNASFANQVDLNLHSTNGGVYPSPPSSVRGAGVAYPSPPASVRGAGVAYPSPPASVRGGANTSGVAYPSPPASVRGAYPSPPASVRGHGGGVAYPSPPPSVRRQSSGDGVHFSSLEIVAHTPGRGAPTNSWSAQRGMAAPLSPVYSHGGSLQATPTAAAGNPMAGSPLAAPSPRSAQQHPVRFVPATAMPARSPARSPRPMPMGSPTAGEAAGAGMEHRPRPQPLSTPSSTAGNSRGPLSAPTSTPSSHSRRGGLTGPDAPASIGPGSRPQPAVSGAQSSHAARSVAASSHGYSRTQPQFTTSGVPAYQPRLPRSGASTPTSSVGGHVGTAATMAGTSARLQQQSDASSKEGKDNDGRVPDDADHNIMTKSVASMLLFFTHWFGTQKWLDWNHDGKFDEDDVVQFLHDFQGLLHIQMFQPKQMKGEKKREVESQGEYKLGEVNSQALEKYHDAPPSGAGRGSPNGDLAEWMQSDVKGDVVAEEDQIIENCRTAFPWFVSVQVLFCGMLWLYWAIMQRPYEIKYTATGYAEENTMAYQFPNDGNEYMWINGEQATTNVDYCEWECNKYESCLGIYYKHIAVPQCVLLSSLPAEACSSQCTSEYDAVIYQKAVVTIWNFISQPGGLDNVFPEKTTLRIHGNFCEGYSKQAYRLFTYQFTHSNMQHMVSNAFSIIFFGAPLELLEGTFWLFLMYQAGVVGGGLCTWLSSPHTNTVGASGGGYALMGMHIGDIILNWNQQKFKKVKILFFALFAIADFVNYALSKDQNMSHSTHVGGFITGMLVQLIIGRKLAIDTDRDKYTRCGAGFAAFILSMGALVWYLTNPFPAARGVSDLFGNDFIGPWCWVAQACVFPEMASGGTCPDWQCVGCADRECVESWYQFANTTSNVHVVVTTWARCRDMAKLLVAPPR